MIYEADNNLRKKLFFMFENMIDTMDTLLLSYLQGYMGKAWANDIENPTAAQILVGVSTYYAGDPNSEAADELLRNLSEISVVIVSSEEWGKRLEAVYQGHIKKFKRYAFKRNPEYLNREHLKSFLSAIPDGYTLKKVDATIANSVSFQGLSSGFTGQFESIDDFINRGVGYCIMYNAHAVCGASSYSVYKDGIEIEIVTSPEHRRKGLATIVAAALMLDCLDRGKYPNWDAANLNSVNLAQKLGYVLEGSYDAYYIDLKNNL